MVSKISVLVKIILHSRGGPFNEKTLVKKESSFTELNTPRVVQRSRTCPHYLIQKLQLSETSYGLPWWCHCYELEAFESAGKFYFCGIGDDLVTGGFCFILYTPVWAQSTLNSDILCRTMHFGLHTQQTDVK